MRRRGKEKGRASGGGSSLGPVGKEPLEQSLSTSLVRDFANEGLREKPLCKRIEGTESSSLQSRQFRNGPEQANAQELQGTQTRALLSARQTPNIRGSSPDYWYNCLPSSSNSAPNSLQDLLLGHPVFGTRRAKLTVQGFQAWSGRGWGIGRPGVGQGTSGTPSHPRRHGPSTIS